MHEEVKFLVTDGGLVQHIVVVVVLMELYTKFLYAFCLGHGVYKLVSEDKIMEKIGESQEISLFFFGL